MERPEGPVPLPPLGALRVFEAAARLGSFTKAAEELCVTQTAVSHQVRLLEESLATPLFVRLTRRVELTEPGRAWAHALSDVFARLYAANRALRVSKRPERPSVSVSVLPSFAARWLVPRLGRFLQQEPDVDLRISPSAELVDFNASELDFGIRFGLGRYPGHKVEKLCDDAWVAVCAPSLARRKRLKTPADLARFTLLHDDNHGWRTWLEARAIHDVDTQRGPVLTDSSMVVEAAVRGQGVGLVRLSLAADDLAAGRLIKPFPRIPLLKTELSYYLVSAKLRPASAPARAFVDWVRAEVQALHRLGL